MNLPKAFSPEQLAELLSDAAKAEMAKPAKRVSQFAEIVGQDGPIWHVVEVYASEQGDVAKALVERRFGVYVPEVEETIVRRGRKIDRRVPMFSGYLFVFMWYSDQHWQWITNTPGVVAIVGALTDAEIDIVRAIENDKRPVIIDIPAIVEAEPVVRCTPKKKRRWKKGRAKAKQTAKTRVVTEQDLRNEIIKTRVWSAFDDMVALDSEGRNQTLRIALGLS